MAKEDILVKVLTIEGKTYVSVRKQQAAWDTLYTLEEAATVSDLIVEALMHIALLEGKAALNGE